MNESLVSEVIRKTVTVDCVVEEAFRVFTSDAMSWWPVATHSITGDEVRQIVFEAREGGEVYELAAQRRLVRLPRGDPASRCRPSDPLREREANEQRAVLGVED